MNTAALLDAPCVMPSPALGERNELVVPPSVVDHESFREWARELDMEHRTRLAWFDNTVWMDASMEEFFFHSRVKHAINMGLGKFVDEFGEGYYVPDGSLLSHPPTGLSSEPDAIYVSFEAMQSKKVILVGSKGRSTELVGSPEMVLEIVSDSSVKKDTVRLPLLYFAAGIVEYWLVDVRSGSVKFDIFQRGDAAYQPKAADADGWMLSALFQKEFRLTVGQNRLGKPSYSLEVR